jgi:hypothetical protein
LHSILQAETDESSHVNLHLFNHSVCASTFKLFHGISNNKYAHALELSHKPYTVLSHSNLDKINTLVLEYAYVIYAWIDKFLYNNDDTDPILGDIHLPMYIHQNELYNFFCTETNDSTTLPSSSTFCNYIQSHYPHVKFLKHTCLGRCTFCLEFPGM